jgi:hypothetical protein
MSLVRERTEEAQPWLCGTRDSQQGTVDDDDLRLDQLTSHLHEALQHQQW